MHLNKNMIFLTASKNYYPKKRQFLHIFGEDLNFIKKNKNPCIYRDLYKRLTFIFLPEKAAHCSIYI